MPFLPLAEQGKEQRGEARQVLLDVRRDDPAHGRSGLHRLHARVEPRQRDDDLGARSRSAAARARARCRSGSGRRRWRRPSRCRTARSRNCGQLGSSRPTRSPGRTPSAASAAANAVLSRSSSPYVSAAPLNSTRRMSRAAPRRSRGARPRACPAGTQRRRHPVVVVGDPGTSIMIGAARVERAAAVQCT